MDQAQIVMKEVFNFDDFKSETQKEAIEQILRGEKRNFVINMATQAGKSLCYQLPGEAFFKFHAFIFFYCKFL